MFKLEVPELKDHHFSRDLGLVASHKSQWGSFGWF